MGGFSGEPVAGYEIDDPLLSGWQVETAWPHGWRLTDLWSIVNTAIFA